MSTKPKVRTWPKIREGVTKGGALFWEVDSGSRLAVRVRQRFEDETQAEDFAEDLRSRLKREGESGFMLTASERENAIEALRELEGTGATLLDAARHYRQHNQPAGGDKTVADVVSEFIDFKTDRQKSRPRYVKDMNSKLSRFAKTFGNRPVKDVTSQEIEQWLYEDTTIGELTRENYFRALTVLFNYAKGRRVGRAFIAKPYRIDNPMDSVHRPVLEETAPEILTVDQARKLLEAARKLDESKGMLAFITLGLFTGLRTSELLQIGWEHVRLDGENDSFVTVPGTIAKKRRIRNVPIPKAARSWLTLAWRNPSGQVAPPNAERKLPEVAAVAKIKPWPSNAMRHSFGSYAYADCDDSARVSAWLGHRGDSMLFEHYRALASKKDAKRFFAIIPKATRQKIVSFKEGTP